MRTRVTVKTWGKSLAGASALTAALLGAGCSPDAATESKANVYLIVTEINAKPGGSSSDEAPYLFSDVIRVKDPVGFFNDTAKIKIRNAAKNPLVGATSHYNDVSLERYSVRYYRTDGRNAEGVDVPYSFQEPLAGTVATESETEIGLTLVRHQAKEEPPLSRLEGSGGADIISTFAEVIMFGKTLSGEVVSVRATIAVTFADFGD